MISDVVRSCYPEFYDRYVFGDTIDVFNTRMKFVQRYGWSCLSNQTIKSIAEFCNGKVIDVGSGSGYLSFKLETDHGIDITAVDDGSWHDGRTSTLCSIWKRDLNIDATKLDLDEYGTIILSWPPYNTSFGYDILKNMRGGQKLIYIGECPGGCTGDDQFHDYLDTSFEEHDSSWINEHHYQFFGLHDNIYLYSKL